MHKKQMDDIKKDISFFFRSHVKPFFFVSTVLLRIINNLGFWKGHETGQSHARLSCHKIVLKCQLGHTHFTHSLFCSSCPFQDSQKNKNLKYYWCRLKHTILVFEDVSPQPVVSHVNPIRIAYLLGHFVILCNKRSVKTQERIMCVVSTLPRCIAFLLSPPRTSSDLRYVKQSIKLHIYVADSTAATCVRR